MVTLFEGILCCKRVQASAGGRENSRLRTSAVVLKVHPNPHTLSKPRARLPVLPPCPFHTISLGLALILCLFLPLALILLRAWPNSGHLSCAEGWVPEGCAGGLPASCISTGSVSGKVLGPKLEEEKAKLPCNFLLPHGPSALPRVPRELTSLPRGSLDLIPSICHIAASP